MKLRGMTVMALMDDDGAVWFADVEGDGEDFFTCFIGDRKMHIDELAPLRCNNQTCPHGKVAGPHCAFVWCNNCRSACPDHQRGFDDWGK